MYLKFNSYGPRVVNFRTKSFSTVTEASWKALKSHYVRTLQVCVYNQDLLGGRGVHSSILLSGIESLFLNKILMNMYAKCGSSEDASHLLGKMHESDEFTWTHKISEHVKSGSSEEALTLFLKMKLEGVELNTGTFCSAFKACAVLQSFEAGNLLYKHMIEIELGIDVFIGSALIDMYVKCGGIEDAFKVFKNMHSKNVVTWSAMIFGFIEHKQYEVALEQFSKMQLEGVKPNEVTFLSALKGCAGLLALDEGRQVHYLIKQGKFDEGLFLASTIVDMYSKCGSLADAHEVFSKMPVRNVVSYSSLIAGYVRVGHAKEALNVFEQMRDENVKPDEVAFVSVLNGLAKINALDEGKQVHALIRKYGCESNKFVGSALVDMYAKCKSVKDAQAVFDNLAERDVVSWSSMIEAYMECNLACEALACFSNMDIEGIKPVSYTFVSVLKACGSLAYLAKGKQVHALIVKMEDEKDIFVASALIDMYVRCGSLEDAERAFKKHPKDNVVLWNAMIAGFVQSGSAAEALNLFRQMHIECVQPNMVTLVGILKACSSIMDVEDGKHIHKYIISIGLESEVMLQNALIDMYAKCGRLEIAQSLFQRLPQRTVVSWNAIIAAYVQFECFEDALKLLWRMTEECLLPDEHTLASVFKACSHLVGLCQGHRLHLLILQSRHCYDVPLYNTLVEMYAKNGSIQAARQVFDSMIDRSIISWNVMIMGYTQHGMGKETFKLFQEMQDKDVKPNHITFVGVLSACSHAGLLQECEFQYILMSQQYRITPTADHLVCMVALLGRAGQFGKAESLVQAFAFEPTLLVWKALLYACTTHGDTGTRWLLGY